jgi:hypothetical protein
MRGLHYLNDPIKALNIFADQIANSELRRHGYGKFPASLHS